MNMVAVQDDDGQVYEGDLDWEQDEGGVVLRILD